MNYYYISDIKAVGKKDEKGNAYMYDAKRGWVDVYSYAIDDYLWGFDPSEDPDSHYAMGNSEIMALISRITEEEAAEKAGAPDYKYIVRRGEKSPTG